MVSLLNESNNQSAHCMAGPPYKNVRFGYSIHSTVKPQKSTFNSYNLFFYRCVVIFNMKYHFLKIFHKKSIIFDAIIGACLNIKLGPEFYFIENGYQDNDRCHVVNSRWPTLIDRTLFSASVNKTPHYDTERTFFTVSSKVQSFDAQSFKRE